MAKVTLTGPLRQYADGIAATEINAANIHQLLLRLGETYPRLAPHLTQGIAVAVDGQIFQDALFQPIAPDAEVHILPAIVGG
jgi:sulfur-carrier protein